MEKKVWFQNRTPCVSPYNNINIRFKHIEYYYYVMPVRR